MKKIIFFMLLLFIISPVYAMEASVEYIDGIYGNRISKDKLYSGQFGFIMDGNRIIYCVEPFAWIGTQYERNDTYFNNLSKDVKTYLKLVANYVDLKVQNKNVEYYMAAQELIWKKLTNNSNFSYSTMKDELGSIIDIEDLKREIEVYIALFNEKPSFDSSVISGNMYETIELTDTNFALPEYKVINESKNEVWTDGFKLYIKILSDEEGTIKFEKKSGSGDVKYYHSANKQDLADLRGEVINTSSIKVKSNQEYYNDYRIEFIDKETNDLIEGNIDFKINDNTYATTNGIFLSRANKGIYNIDIINAPYGYLKDEQTTFEIKDGSTNNYIHKIYLDKPKAKLNIDVEKEDYYELFKDNKLISNFKNDISFDLPLGIYKVLDHLNGKTYIVDLSYVDQYTKLVEKNLTIPYQEKIEDNLSDDIISKDIDEKNYCVLNNFKELPNTIDYIKAIKIIILIIIVIEILRHVKEIFKN